MSRQSMWLEFLTSSFTGFITEEFPFGKNMDENIQFEKFL